MEIHLFNTLGKKKELFTPLTPGVVKMYHCGPTVYNYIHIGNLRAFFLADMIRRLFEYDGYEVDQVMNITDVDDKTIKKSQAENISLKELTSKYEQAFLDDLKSLNILTPKKTPRATDSIPAMVEIISKLLDKGIAYKAEDGVYFSINKSEKYGELVGLNRKEEQSLERIKNDEYDKENPQDFALWKFHTEADKEIFWEAPFGKGRPGWHIECSAMAMENLGETIDIHTGGIDLMFPHHTNEIAQSESATGKTFVRYWMHNGFISIDNTKISKSLKNDIYLKDIQEKNINPLTYRYWLLTAHYQSLVNFTWEALAGSTEAYSKIIKFIAQNPEATPIKTLLSDSIIASVYNNLETPQAIAELWKVMKNDEYSIDERIGAILEADKLLGLDLQNQARKINIKVEIPPEIQRLIDEREKARQEKDFVKADLLRDEIEKAGIKIEDKK